MENASGLMSKRGAGGPEVENRGSTLRASWWAKGARESEREREAVEAQTWMDEPSQEMAQRKAGANGRV